MASFGYWGAVALAIGVGTVSAGCGGSSFAAAGNDNDASNADSAGGASGGGASGGGASSGGDASNTDGAGSSSGVTSSSGSSGGGTADASNDGAATGDAVASDSGTGGGEAGTVDASGPNCPNVTGSYSITLTQSGGCGTLGITASQCIRNNGGCNYEMRSNAASGGNPAIAGSFTLSASGTFDNAALQEGNANRTGCTGSWNATTSTMTVDCGGTNTTQSCVVSLLRTSTTASGCN
jgi:hypothetical protein